MDRTPVLTPADLAEGGSALPLSAEGAPEQALALVDLDAAVGLSGASLDRAVAAAAVSSRVLIGIGALPAPSRLMQALTCTLAPADTGPVPSTCVRVPDRDEAVAVLSRQVAAAPYAAVTLVGLLRLTSRLPVPEGLVAESLAYAMLLAGPEFAAWRAGRPGRQVDQPSGQPVLLEREADVLTITLNRPERHNAYGRRVRDALVAALEVAVLDTSVRRVRLRGAGASFCSGGDLDEFGTAPHVAAAHVVRLERSAGALLHACRDRVVAELHGSCIGAGLELPAFATTVLAREGTRFQLPELRMGLVPGAGGTVSVTARVGRWRTAHLALSGQPVDLGTALEWGLVDRRADA